jgi:hypothetical protein
MELFVIIVLLFAFSIYLSIHTLSVIERREQDARKRKHLIFKGANDNRPLRTERTPIDGGPPVNLSADFWGD